MYQTMMKNASTALGRVQKASFKSPPALDTRSQFPGRSAVASWMNLSISGIVIFGGITQRRKGPN